jgi:hypothetical protein
MSDFTMKIPADDRLTGFFSPPASGLAENFRQRHSDDPAEEI